MTEHASGSPPLPPADSSPQRGWIPPRFGLVRPKTGRQVAGVCAAIGNATGTDPVLWRVVLAVLTLFGGVGAMVYIAGWLLLPEEGDEVSPVEGLLGRGRSTMSAPVTVLLAVAVVVLAVVAVAGDMGATLLLAALLGGLAVLVSRTSRQREQRGPDGESSGPPPAGPPSWPGATHRPPFAPHGPYAADKPADTGEVAPGTAQHGTDPLLAEAERLRGGLHLTEPLPDSPPAHQPSYLARDTVVLPAPPPRPRSVLGRVTISLTVLALGLVAVLDLVGLGITPSWYFATALATIGLGLLVGAWFGRARGLIAVGAVLAPLLLVVSLAEGVNLQNLREGDYGGNVKWAPTGITDIQPRYEHAFGNAELDLRKVAFADQRREVQLVNSAGNTTVLLPPDVDTTVHVMVTAGNATVFGTEYSGVRLHDQVITNAGDDGPGGGELVLRLEVNAGNVEVQR